MNGTLPYGYHRTSGPAHPDQQDGEPDVIHKTNPRIVTRRLINGLYEVTVGTRTAIGPGNSSEEPNRIDHVMSILAAEHRADRTGKRFT